MDLSAAMEMQKIHLQTGPKDVYGLGMYNGMELVLALTQKREPLFLTLDEYLGNTKEDVPKQYPHNGDEA